MLTGPFQMLGGFIGLVSKWYPDISGGLCLTLFLPWIMFRSGVMVDMKQLVSNYKAIIFRGMLDNFLTLACISLGTYYLFPITGINSLHFTDHLIIGAVFLPSSFVIHYPPPPFPYIELIDDHSIVLGENALGIALSLMLLKHVKRLDLLQLTINSRLLLQLACYLAYMLAASSMLGLLIGWLLSFCGPVAKVLVFKSFNPGSNVAFCRGATIVLFVPAYLSYRLAEHLDLSGAMCVFFYGIAVANYILPKDPELKAYWRDDIHRVVAVLRSILFVWVGASGIAQTLKQWKCLENRLEIVFGVSIVLLVTLICGKLVSVYPLSCCRIGQQEFQKLATDPVFSNPWGLPNLCACWIGAKARTANYKPNHLLFNRWGLGKIEPQVMTMANVQNAETFLLGLTLGCVLVPSVLSYLLAYDQFIKSNNNQLALVHSCIVIVYLCTSMVFDEWGRWTETNFVSQSLPVRRQARKKKQ